MELLLLLLVVPMVFMIGDSLSDDDGEDGNEDAAPEPNHFDGGDGADEITGTDLLDEIRSGGGDDVIDGRAGDDTIVAGTGDDQGTGGDGDDLIYGGAGNDTFIGGSGDDQIFLGDGNDQSLPDAASGLMSDAGNDLVRGGDGDDEMVDLRGANTLYGDTGDDRLTAYDPDPLDEGSDLLFGGFGADLLAGDDGDTLSGGEGTDSFVVLADDPGGQPVTISDIDSAESLTVIWDDDALGQATNADLRLEQDPDTGAAHLFVGDHHIAVLQDGGAFPVARVDLQHLVRERAA